jgi:hypothetical protein
MRAAPEAAGLPMPAASPHSPATRVVARVVAWGFLYEQPLLYIRVEVFTFDARQRGMRRGHIPQIKCSKCNTFPEKVHSKKQQSSQTMLHD